MIINNFIIYRLFANLVAFWLAGEIVPGFETTGFLSLLCASIVLTFLHIFIRPVMVFLTLPLQVLSLGLAYLVFNAFYVKITSFLVKGIVVEGFFPAIVVALIISFVNIVLDGMSINQRRKRNISNNDFDRF